MRRFVLGEYSVGFFLGYGLSYSGLAGCAYDV